MFYQNQTKVEPSVVKYFTKDCQKEDCMVSVRCKQTTMAATFDYYDKNGNLVIKNQNDGTFELFCDVCEKFKIVNKSKDVLETIE